MLRGGLGVWGAAPAEQRRQRRNGWLAALVAGSTTTRMAQARADIAGPYTVENAAMARRRIVEEGCTAVRSDGAPIAAIADGKERQRSLRTQTAKPRNAVRAAKPLDGATNDGFFALSECE